ncbi:MAG TPA: hypothetical protein ENN03_07615 [bacterium]|nr:hypothetical protein [bacterium]
MKKSFFFILLIVLGCETFPDNPKGEPIEKRVDCTHVQTEYVPAKPSIEGLDATKVNLLTFQFRTQSVSTRALEFHALVVLNGPPNTREHAVIFRTDEILIAPDGNDIELPVFSWIEAGETYLLVRPKFPTNEYVPFDGDQGRVVQVSLTAVYALDERGQKTPVPFIGNSLCSQDP